MKDSLDRIASALERIAEALEGRFHSGGIGGGLREGEIPAILSRGYDVDGKDVREWINSNDVKYPESDKKPE